VLVKFFQWLDRKEFLSYRLWEFSLRNLFRFFPYHFLFRVLLIHPLKALRGVSKYQKLVNESKRSDLYGTRILEDIFNQLKTGMEDSCHFVLAPGFCMKPYEEEKGESTCPVGHFNHRCLVLEKPAMFLKDQNQWQQPCSNCNLGTLALLSANMKSDFYIMTSARDITNDLFLPAIKNRGARMGIFLLCPYSTEAFTWGLAISGIDGALTTFCKGDCLNHGDFTKADIGIKEKQTYIDEAIFDRLKTELTTLAQSKDKKGQVHSHYINKNNVYKINNLVQNYKEGEDHGNG